MAPPEFRESVLSYVTRPAKRLRPAVLLMSCGSVSGDVRRAVPAATGIEMFHTWTLVHDDVIDNDSLRRGAPTVHAAMADRFRSRKEGPADRAEEYGRDIAILAGDMQHGWAIRLFLDCATRFDVDASVVLALVSHLETHVLGKLIEGEVLDVKFGMVDGDRWRGLTEQKIVEMLRLKTGVLYEFAGMAGAMIGLNCARLDDPRVCAIGRFAGSCGTAFQLQDDILGVTGDEKALGKPVGSDIREGKKTVIVLEALKNASDAQQADILSVLGNRSASDDAIRRITTLFQDLGGIEHARKLAQRHHDEARENAKTWLGQLPATPCKDLLLTWSDYVVDRSS